jgi:hypothetical protein
VDWIHSFFQLPQLKLHTLQQGKPIQSTWAAYNATSTAATSRHGKHYLEERKKKTNFSTHYSSEGSRHQNLTSMGTQTAPYHNKLIF